MLLATMGLSERIAVSVLWVLAATGGYILLMAVGVIALGFMATACAALVALSTLFTKQHYVVDLVGGIALALAGYVLFLRGYLDSGYLGYEAAEGIDWFWEHRIDGLAQVGV